MFIAVSAYYERFPSVSDQEVASVLRQANEFEGLKFGGIAMVGPYQVYTTKKQISTIDDFKGQKIREAGGVTKAVVEALGATPFFAPATSTDAAPHNIVSGP